MSFGLVTVSNIVLCYIRGFVLVITQFFVQDMFDFEDMNGGL